jgi:rifampicin phosphotransferase
MTDFFLTLDQLEEKDRPMAGGKALSLAAMHNKGFLVPRAICLNVEAYLYYVTSTGLIDQIVLDLFRKPFEDMRWEEIWDTALRIRNSFLRTPVPLDLRETMLSEFESRFSKRPVSVRSSAPGEDSSKTSFAGLHESFVNIRGPEAILEHVRLVWASLWSDRALLYRQELGLDVKKSSMAVIIQEMISGERSGIVFGKSPADETLSVIEAVYGLNQGLVDGTIEPDRWELERKNGRIVSHDSVRREKAVRPAEDGIRLEVLPPKLQHQPPLIEKELFEVHSLCMNAEKLFGNAQDMEWTYRGEDLHALQSRPITIDFHSKDDQRPWYLSLHRSFENLKELRTKIEDELLPAMEEEARSLALMKLEVFSNLDLADEIEKRSQIHQRWLEIYKRDCIPFAHGMRLFGQVYNDMVQPEDPFEFVELLSETGMVSTQRNRMIQDIATMIKKDTTLSECLKKKKIEDCGRNFLDAFNNLTSRFGDIAWGDGRFVQDSQKLLELIMEMAGASPTVRPSGKRHTGGIEETFLSKFKGEQRVFAVEILDIARASYRLRDDDNIYLGKIEGQMLAAVEEGASRLTEQYDSGKENPDPENVIGLLRGKSGIKSRVKTSSDEIEKKTFQVRARQIVGQPAGRGLATGKARVVSRHSDLFEFKRGEILVCDSIDPGMTFVIPLASAIVERRGGMLIHGAIIAREYGLPCVTGAPDAARWIKTGDTITVDGYLGIVIMGEPALRDSYSSDIDPST